MTTMSKPEMSDTQGLFLLSDLLQVVASKGTDKEKALCAEILANNIPKEMYEKYIGDAVALAMLSGGEAGGS